MSNGNLKLQLTIQADGSALVKATQQGAQGLQKVGDAAADTTIKIRGVADANSSVTASFSQIGKGAAIFGVIASMASQAGSVISALPKAGFAYNAELEVSRLGMAGILASMTAINGQQTTFVQGQQMAAQIVTRLADEAARTAANTTELVGAFQALLGPGMAAGMTIEQIQRLTVAGVSAVKSLGLQQQQVVQELRDLVQGGITASSSTLATALGLKDSDIAKARASAQGLFAFLMERMKGFEESSDKFADTVTGRMQALQEQATRSAAAAMGPFMVALSQQAAQLTEALKSTEGSAALDQMAARAGALVGQLGMVVQVGMEYSGVLASIAAAYAALGLAGRVSQWFDLARAKAEAARVSQLAAVHAIAEGQASAAVAQTTRQEIAAKIAGMQATAGSAKAAAAEAAAKVEALKRSADVIAQARATAQVRLEEANSTYRAASAMGAHSAALAAVREATAQRSRALRDLGSLGQAHMVVEKQMAGATAASQVASNNAATAAHRLAQAKDAVSVSSRAARAAASGFSSVIGALGGTVGIAITALTLLAAKFFQVRAEAAKAKGAKLSEERVSKALESGEPVDGFDLGNVQSNIAELKRQRDDLELEFRALQATGIASTDAVSIAAAAAAGGIDASASMASDALDANRQKLAQVEGDIARQTALTERAAEAANAATAGIGLNAAQSGKALNALLEDVKTATSLRDKARQQTDAITAATAREVAAMRARKASGEAIAAVEAKSAEAIKQVNVKLAQDLKQLNEQGTGDAKALAEGRHALAKALAEKTAEEERAAIDGFSRANEAAYRTGARDAEDYYSEKSRLALADIALQAKALRAELDSAKAAESGATRTEDVLRAKARVAEVETRLIELGRERAKVDAPEDYAIRQWEAYAAIIEKRYEAAAEGADALARELQDLEFEGALIGKNAEAVRALNMARAEELALRLESDARIMRDIDLSGRTSDALERQAAQIRKIAETKAGNEAAQVTAQAWEETARSIKDGLTDSLFRAFEAGKGFFKTLWDGVKNTLKTTVLKVAIEGVVGGVTGGVSSAVQAAGGGGGGGGILSNIGTIGTLASGAGLLGAAGLGLQAGFGALLSGGFSGIAAAVSGGLAAIGTGVGASIAAGLGTIAGALGPVALGIYAVSRLFDGGGGPKTESTYDTGYASLARPGSDPSYAQQISDSIEGAYQQLADSLGLAVRDLEVGVFTAVDSAGDAMTQLQVVARQAGQEIYNRGARLGGDGTGRTPGGIENVGRSEEELRAAVAVEMQQVLLSALQKSDLAEKYREYLAQATDVSSAISTVAAVAQLDKVLRSLGGPMASLADLSVEAEVALVNQMGGLQSFTAALDSYRTNFYSEAERQAATMRQLGEAFSAMGVAMPQTHAGFRALMDGALSRGDTGMVSKLLVLQGAFNEVVPAAEEATQALEASSATLDEVARQRKALLEQEQQAMLELVKASGNADLVRSLELQSIDASNRAIYERVDALNAELAAQQRANDLLSQGRAMELELYRAMGDTARVRELELAAMDPSLRALQLLQYELQDLQAAGNGAATGVGNAAQALQQRQQLEGQLLQLLGDTAEIRRRELAALDPANRGLQAHIYAVQDAQAAVEAANAAYQQARQAAEQAAQAIQEQVSAQQQAASQLQQDMQRWVNLRRQASGLLGQISTSLGGPDTREADLWARLNGGDMEDQLSAAQELYSLITQTAQVETQAAQQALSNAQAMLDVGRQLREYVQGLRTGDLTALTPAEALGQARADYQAAYAAAAGGDTDAQRKLQGLSDTYLRLAREFDPESYTSVFNAVTGQLDSLGSSLMDAGAQQVAAQQALIDATATGNTLSAAQVAKLEQLQDVVQGLRSQADASATTTNAQLFIANANLSSLQAQRDAANAVAANVASGVDAAQAALVAAQAEAAEYLASHLEDIATAADPVPVLLQDMPERIAAALAPLINAASAGSATAGKLADIDRLYQQELGRNADASGAQFYANSGLSNEDIRAQLNASPEGQVADAYRDIMGREPDAAGSAYYTAQVANGRPISEVRADLEYSKAHGAHAEGLNRVPFDGYRAVLHADERVLTAENAQRLDDLYSLVEAATALRVPQLPALTRLDAGRMPADALVAVVRPLLAELAAVRAELAQLRTENNAGHRDTAMATVDNTEQIGQRLLQGRDQAERRMRVERVATPV